MVGAKGVVVAGGREEVELVEVGGRLGLGPGTKETHNGPTHQQPQDGVEPLKVTGLKEEEVKVSQVGAKEDHMEVQAGTKEDR